MDQFIKHLKDRVIEIDHLDGYILHELIERIEIGAPDRRSGHRTQSVHIKYAGIGFIPINGLMKEQTA